MFLFHFGSLESVATERRNAQGPPVEPRDQLLWIGSRTGQLAELNQFTKSRDAKNSPGKRNPPLSRTRSRQLCMISMNIGIQPSDDDLRACLLTSPMGAAGMSIRISLVVNVDIMSTAGNSTFTIGC